jgi:hypothetical protein
MKAGYETGRKFQGGGCVETSRRARLSVARKDVRREI